TARTPPIIPKQAVRNHSFIIVSSSTSLTVNCISVFGERPFYNTRPSAVYRTTAVPPRAWIWPPAPVSLSVVPANLKGTNRKVGQALQIGRGALDLISLRCVERERDESQCQTGDVEVRHDISPRRRLMNNALTDRDVRRIVLRLLNGSDVARGHST